MFSGIVETTGIVEKIVSDKSNLNFIIECAFTHELKIDQSIAHNGACLTVVELFDNKYMVTAIEETLLKTNLGNWKVGDRVNLERCMKIGDRLDGHIVQGHVDKTATCIAKEDLNGSWQFRFRYKKDNSLTTVPKGSVCINGVSLTVVESKEDEFTVHIIPYTYKETNFSALQVGDTVNLEFDIIGKYVLRYMALQKN